ncbi:MAG: DUF4922 domain-containing protein [Bacteroides sp.]|nr:DUF4922 domain-containing protein [Bacteroides sp.]
MEVLEFIEEQLRRWPQAAERFRALEGVETKSVKMPCGESYRVQFNPARAVSTRAKVDPAAIAARPCFLCAGNRPPEQMSLPWEDLEILVNPFPIFPGHLTIAAREHQPQSLQGRVEQMKRLSRALPGYTVFFNGAKAGASAPDHFHFQAVPSRFMRISSAYESYELDAEGAETVDEMINAVCTDGVLTVIPRRKHRPECYDEIGVSPASIDLCGTLIAVCREDFDALTGKRVEQIIREVTEQEPQLYVGLTGNAEEFTTDADGLHTVSGVRIGDGFHWQRDETFRYGGKMMKYRGRLVNRIGLEEYLKSVISSEMSATSSMELLKAHAVISRSWVLAQMRASRARACAGVPIKEADGADFLQWFDRDDHEGFDVCSDDHCQRYQGLTRQTSPAVAEAVEATRGLVLLTSDGQIADARFSKCCGGAFELFENCWEPHHHPYLEAGPDAPAAAPLPDLTREDNARRWILTSPEAYCNCEDSEVLAQVLNDFDRETTPDFYRWEVNYGVDELSELVHRRSGIDFGRIEALEPVRRGPSGRIYQLKIIGSRRSMTIGKELIIRRWLSESHLCSSAFVVDRRGDSFRLRGAGWGHGVGLCQIGAAMMAAKGFDFRAILNHYFPNTILK